MRFLIKAEKLLVGVGSEETLSDFEDGVDKQETIHHGYL